MRRENNVMPEFVLRNEVYFVTRVIGIVCTRGERRITHSEACASRYRIEFETIARSQPESQAALPIEVD